MDLRTFLIHLFVIIDKYTKYTAQEQYKELHHIEPKIYMFLASRYYIFEHPEHRRKARETNARLLG